MARFIATLSFTAHVEIEAPDYDAAESIADGMLDARSVYEDDKLDEVIDKAFCAGGGVGDPPLLKGHKACELRDADFQPDQIAISEMKEERCTQ